MKPTTPSVEPFLSLNRRTYRTPGEASRFPLKWTIRFLVAFFALAAVQPVKADSVTWDLQNLVFASGQVATGSFTVQNGNLTNWDIQISGGTDPALTNVTFVPGTSCVAFCGELFSTTTPPPTQSGLDVRTPLASNNTFLELVLYFNNVPLSDLSNPNVSTIAVNSQSAIESGLLVSPNLVEGLGMNDLSPSATSASIVAVDEPPALALFCFALAALFVFVNPRSFWRREPPAIG